MKNEMKIYDLGILMDVRSKLNIDEISVYNLKNVGLTFNSKISTELVEAGAECLNFAENEYTGDFFLIFSNSDGKRLSKVGGRSKSNLTSQSKAIVELFCKLAGIKVEKGGRKIIKISKNMSKFDDKFVYKVLI